MLPPMAIFFPLFTLLEDLGYLPRVAFNLDRTFQKVPGLRQAGSDHVHGLRLQRGRGGGLPHHRFPAGTAHCHAHQQFCALQRPVPHADRDPDDVFCGRLRRIRRFAGFGGAAHGAGRCWAWGATFLASRLLSGTVLKGVPSSFTLELPPYRRPQIGKVIVRSIFDRTLFVLGRAAMVAAPAGMLIWVMANLTLDGPNAPDAQRGVSGPGCPLFRPGRRNPAWRLSWASQPTRSSCPSSSWRIFQQAVWWR